MLNELWVTLNGLQYAQEVRSSLKNGHKLCRNLYHARGLVCVFVRQKKIMRPTYGNTTEIYAADWLPLHATIAVITAFKVAARAVPRPSCDSNLPCIKGDFGSNKTLFDTLTMPRRGMTREDVSAIIALYKGGHRKKDIVRQTGVHQKTVQRLIRRFQDNDELFLPVPKPRSGRPPSISPRTKLLMNRQVFNNPRLSVAN